MFAGTAEVNIAQNLQQIGGAPIQTDLGVLVGSFVGVAILVGALAAFGYMVLGGVQWITSGGDKGKIEKAREKNYSIYCWLRSFGISLCYLFYRAVFLWHQCSWG
ncbi:hypothetical protein LRY65_00845 [Candidatus Woesebacteria bacterium]|nr:hypothetical protein [Candidatus Woesebacteria bacterium]